MLHGPFQTGTIHFAHALRAFLSEDEDAALYDAASMADGVYVQAVIDAARRSSDRKVWECIPPTAIELARQHDRATRKAALAAASSGAGSDDDDDDESFDPDP